MYFIWFKLASFSLFFIFLLLVVIVLEGREKIIDDKLFIYIFIVSSCGELLVFLLLFVVSLVYYIVTDFVIKNAWMFSFLYFYSIRFDFVLYFFLFTLPWMNLLLLDNDDLMIRFPKSPWIQFLSFCNLISLILLCDLLFNHVIVESILRFCTILILILILDLINFKSIFTIIINIIISSFFVYF